MRESSQRQPPPWTTPLGCTHGVGNMRTFLSVKTVSGDFVGGSTGSTRRSINRRKMPVARRHKRRRLRQTVPQLILLAFLLQTLPLISAFSSHSTHIKLQSHVAACRRGRASSLPIRHAEQSSRLAAHQITVDATAVLDDHVQSQLSDLVKQRADARWKGDYAAADTVRQAIERLQVPDNFQVAIEDIARKDGGGSTWKLVYTLEAALDIATTPGVLNLAHAALGLVISSQERNVPVPTRQLEPLVRQAKEQLLQWSRIHDELCSVDGSFTDSEDGAVVSLDRLRSLTSNSESSEQVALWSAVEEELRGRKAADAAFWFALAGVNDLVLFDLLTRVCTKELKRFGGRPSCRAKDVLGIVERLAAAGVRDDPDLQHVATQCLGSKTTAIDQIEIDPAKMFNLHSDHCALMIWKFSTRQRKQRSFLLTAAKHWDERHEMINSQPTIRPVEAVANLEELSWFTALADPTKKLVVDVGCGMGMSVLGLASLDTEMNQQYDWSTYNYVGVDLSQIGIGYAKGIAQRWDLNDRAAFVVGSAELFLESLENYPGPVELVMLQFPTPFRLARPLESSSRTEDVQSKGGNSQLPTSVTDGFMVTPTLLKLAADLLKRHDSTQSGKLILQSNCEDVAVWMRNTATSKSGLQVESLENHVERIEDTPTRRTLDWIAMGGARAEGPGWSAEILLPPSGRTETEIACILNGTPVHRCVLGYPS